MNLYRSEDIDAIDKNLDEIIEKSMNIQSEILEPTIFECKNIQKVILDYIKSKKLIIYGGTAYNELIKDKNIDDKIYKDNECKDVEFYSPHPIQNLKELCIILNENFKYVQGKSAQHPETYTIYVNFKQYCDITYMPGNIYYNMYTMKVNNLVCSHPSFILIDILRQYNDPINSYWRLREKTFSRANILLKHYPLELSDKTIPEKDDPELNKIYSFIFDNIKDITSLIHIGCVAENFYLKKKIILNDCLRCFSVVLKNDCKLIYQVLLKYLSTINKLDKSQELLSVKEYFPFFQFWDKHVVFLYNNIPIIELYGNNEICLPYHNVSLETTDIVNIPVYKITEVKIGGHRSESDKPIKVATFILLLNFLIIDMHYKHINKLTNDEIKIQIIIKKLLIKRDEFLTKHKLTVMDKSPYQEFIMDCIGKTMAPMRKNLLLMDAKRKRGERTQYIFNPDKDDYDDAEIHHENKSGNIVKNNKLLIVNH